MAPDHHIPNALKRSEVHRKAKREKGQKKLKRRMEQRKLERQDPTLLTTRLSTNIPRTLENTRRYDSTSYLTANPMSEESLEVRKRLEEEKERKGKGKKVVVESESEEESEDEEEEDVTMGDGNKMKRKGKGKVGNLIPTGAVNGDDQEDEEENSNSNNDNDDEEEEEEESTSNPPTSYIPRILLTTSPHPTNRTHLFLRDLLSIFPGGEIRKRPRGRGYELGRIARWAAKEERGYDVLMVVNEDHKTPNAITIINLPAGPTAYFKLTSVQLGKEIHGHARPSPHSPELILNNFQTLLGLSIGRLFGSLFPPQPMFRGRQVVTLHNQRDFLFFRRHRYMFASPTSAKLQEIGPRFTLKLRWLRKGLPAVGAADGVAPSGGGVEVDDDDEEEEDNEGEEVEGKMEDVDEGKLDDVEMGEGMEVDDTSRDQEEEDKEGKDDGKKVGKGKNGQRIPKLDEQQEYEWKWKPKMEVSRSTFFL